MPLCPQDGLVYREPTAVERQFLAIITRGNATFEAQIAHAEIAEYDPTGWSYIRVAPGSAPSMWSSVEGPSLDEVSPDGVRLYIETILWPNSEGMLEAVEIIEYARRRSDSPYARFIDADARGTLTRRP